MDRQQIDQPARRPDSSELHSAVSISTMTAERSSVLRTDEAAARGRVASRPGTTPVIARTARATVGELQLDVVTDEAGLLALRPAWEELHVASGAAGGSEFNPFTNWSWMWTWWRSHARRSRVAAQPRYSLEVLVIRDRSDVVRAIVPFVRARWGIGPLSFRALRMFGFGPCTTDLRTPIVWAGWEDVTGDLLARHLASGSTATRDFCVLDGLPTANPLTSRLEAWARSSGWSWGPTVPSYSMELPPTWEEFRGSLRGHIRKSVRHAYNGLARDGHVWTFDAITDPAEIRAALVTFLKLHSTRATSGQGPRHLDYYARPADRRMLRTIAAELAADGSFVVGRLRIGEDVVAIRLMLLGGDAVYMYDAGSDLRWSKYAVGTTLTAECLRWAIGRGVHWAHLGTGTDPSKARWAAEVRDLRRLQVVAPTLPGRLLVGVRRLPGIARMLAVASLFATEALSLDSLT